MPTAYTPTAQSTTANPAVHADGDPGNAAAFNAPLEPLLDRAAYARDALTAQIVWEHRLSVDTGGTNAVFAVRVPPIAAIALPDGAGTRNALSQPADATLGILNVEGLPGTLSNSAWYYVYAHNSSGALAFQISTTAPDAGRIWKSGTTTHRYLGCVRTDGAGAPLPMRMHRGRYRYQFTAIGGAGSPLRVLSAGSAVVPTDVSCADVVPPHARLVDLLSAADGTIAAAVGDGRVRTNGDTTDWIVLQTDPDVVNTHVLEMTLDSARILEYQVSGANQRLTLDVLGYSE